MHQGMWIADRCPRSARRTDYRRARAAPLCSGGYDIVANVVTTRLIPRTKVWVKGQRLPWQAPRNDPGCCRQPQHTRGCNYAHLTYHQHRQPPSDGDPNPRSPPPPPAPRPQGMHDDDGTTVVRTLFFMGHGRASLEVT